MVNFDFAHSCLRALTHKQARRHVDYATSAVGRRPAFNVETIG